MRILLTTLNSKYIHSNLALRYLFGVTEGSGLDVKLQEFTINNDMDYIYTEILQGQYDFVCFSCYVWNVEKVLSLTKDLKKANPAMKILLGGPEVSYDSIEFMESHSWIDYIIRGEGEYPFFRFCSHLVLEDYDFSQVPALVYRRDGQICQNPVGPVLDINKIPFPYEKFPVDMDKVVYYESSRGCPYRCSYCLSSLDKSVRTLSMERTRRDLSYFLYKEVKQVKLVDRTFNYDIERAKEIWKYLIVNDNGVTNFHFEICGELLDDEAFSLLSKARPGLFQFEIGIQSCNPQTLAAVDRKEEVFLILHNVKRLVAMEKFHIHVDLIAGLPYEDYKSFARSFNKVYGLRADHLQLGFLKLLKGTKISGQADSHDYVWRDYAPYEVIANRYLSAGELAHLKMIDHVLDLYYNKGGFQQSMTYLQEKVATTPFTFYESLAKFFYDHGYQHRSHKKEDLYRILLKFAVSYEGVELSVDQQVKEVLGKDLKETMNFDAVKKFYQKGWEING